MWERIDSLLERAPSPEGLRLHRVELLEARRRRAAGLPVGPELVADEAQAIADELAAVPLLARVRSNWDGPLVLVKGPEVGLDYPGPRLRRFGDLDLLTDDPHGAQAALLAAGFQEVCDPDVYVDIHHLRPLWWPGLPLVVELHMRPNWPAGVPAPSVAELLEAAVPCRVGVPGVMTLPAAHHALLLAAHAWAHQPLGRLGNLIDVAVTLRRSDSSEVAALARDWGCSRLWSTTHATIGSVLEGEGRSAGAAMWARHLGEARERTVFEWHVHRLLAPAWGLPRRRVPGAMTRALLSDVRREGSESLHDKLRRTRLAFGNAGVGRSEHDLVLAARGHTTSTRGTEAG